MGLGTNEEGLLLHLCIFLQKGGNDQSWGGLNQVNPLFFLQNNCPAFSQTTDFQMFWHSGCCLICFFF